jgi:hypothetical protein
LLSDSFGVVDGWRRERRRRRCYQKYPSEVREDEAYAAAATVMDL